jgi:hypothetical protein
MSLLIRAASTVTQPTRPRCGRAHSVLSARESAEQGTLFPFPVGDSPVDSDRPAAGGRWGGGRGAVAEGLVWPAMASVIPEPGQNPYCRGTIAYYSGTVS